ncbi:hypothetical protein LCGC14_0529250 [marine sediment metagenome]|uniref:Uncharacterized protein n=1 Tax=marine sediment metagenome TaxID=412755 RepID=A0A0F9UHK8_9ZZZZ
MKRMIRLLVVLTRWPRRLFRIARDSKHPGRWTLCLAACAVAVVLALSLGTGGVEAKPVQHGNQCPREIGAMARDAGIAPGSKISYHCGGR